MTQMRKLYIAPTTELFQMEVSHMICNSNHNKAAGTIGGNGSQTSGEHVSYGGEDPGEDVSADAKSHGSGLWDEWE